MNQVATVDQAQATRLPAVRSVLIDMATRFGMEPAAFEATVRATCMKPDKNGRVPSREEFAAFLLVAKEYNLNPLTKEIYAFSAKGGGIVPIVSIDGWVNLVNSHGACDGFEFDMEHDAKGNLVSCTCRMYRKDRSRPVSVTEYLSECVRNTEPWAMKHRMLRHKALVQASRYAFGFSGVYDEDEGAKIAELRDVTPREEPPAPPAIAHQSGVQAEINQYLNAENPREEPEVLAESGRHDPQQVEWTEPVEEAAATDQPPVPPPASSDFPGDKPMKPSNDDGLDIPAEFRRTQPEKADPISTFNVDEWLTSLGNTLSGCEDTEQLGAAQAKYQTPFKAKVSKADWAKSQQLVMDAFTRISKDD